MAGAFRIVNAQGSPKPNFIFIVVDDLNDYTQSLGGQPQIFTPNIQELSDMGISFENGFCNATGCAPSRTSLLSGKDLFYTGVYSNSDYVNKFRENFTEEKNNEEVFTLPEILKDSGGYYTFAINKVFHSPTENDYDKNMGTPACEKKKSWNKMQYFSESPALADSMFAHRYGDFFYWGKMPDSYESGMQDYQAADTAIKFINAVAAGTANTCGKPFFLALGCHLPHAERYVPAKYFPPYFVDDILHEPFVIPYNDPPSAFPYNGYVMPPQPDIEYGDYFDLPEGSLARQFADANEDYEGITEYVNSLPYWPVIDSSLTDDERRYILEQTVRANLTMSYFAGTQYIDAQIGRVIDALQSHPELMQNTIIILVSDNGYSLGEKRHWGKWTLWETINRVPFILVHPDLPHGVNVNRTVSLLDVFPTVLDLAGITKYPKFADGSNYLDGMSLKPLLMDTELELERPVLESYRKLNGSGSCFPHYGVRNERFHFIRYQTNNDGSLGTGACSASLSEQEDELYEIEEDRNIDPEEWNNLAYDTDYAIVKEYLQQWFPDSTKYLQQAYKIKIMQPHSACSYRSTDTVFLSALLYDEEGNALSSVPADKHIKWWTNSGSTPVSGISNTLALSSFPDIVSGTQTSMIIYLALYNDDHTVIDGLDMLTINIDNTTENYPRFKVKTNKRKASITGIIYPAGTYTASWDYGDGSPVYNGLIPPQHSYSAYGNYTISCSAVIGTADGCTVTKNVAIFCDSGKHMYVRLTPNPVQHMLTANIDGEPGIYTLSVYNTAGIKVREETVLCESGSMETQLNTEDLAEGIYYIRISSGTDNEIVSFVKIK